MKFSGGLALRYFSEGRCDSSVVIKKKENSDLTFIQYQYLVRNTGFVYFLKIMKNLRKTTIGLFRIFVIFIFKTHHWRFVIQDYNKK